MLYYKKYIIKLSKQFIKGDRKWLYFIIIGCLPISIVGLLSKDLIESIFNNISTSSSILAYTFISTAVFLFLTKNINSQKELTFKIVFIVGILQIFSVLPGISRSGITICSLLILGVNHKDAVRFSFLMAIPIILGASFLSVLEGNFKYDSSSIILGLSSSFFFGLLAIYLTNHLIELKKYWLFSIYCFIIAIIIFIKGII